MEAVNKQYPTGHRIKYPRIFESATPPITQTVSGRRVISQPLISALLVLSLFFVSVACGIYLGEKTGDTVLGFGFTGIICLGIALIIFLSRNSLQSPQARGRILRHLLADKV
jgi:hypothetical protein